MGLKVIVVCAGFILFDVITGLMKAFYDGSVNSTELRHGMYHKLSECITLIGSKALEHGAEYVDLGVSLPMLNLVASYICVMEAISILENLSAVNPELGGFLAKYLEKLREKK